MKVYIVYTLREDTEDVEDILRVFAKESDAVQYLDDIQEEKGSWHRAAFTEFELE